jgi:HD-like signal output (HDOD) protein
MMNPKVAEAIRQSAAVPSIPQVVMRFLEVIQDPNFNYDDVVKVLSVDAGMVSEVLRLSNSALFGVSRKVTTLKQALTLLGPRRTRSLVIGRYLTEAVGNTGEGLIDRSYFWRRSLASAVIAARIADEVCPRQRDEVFLGALLADVGVTILAEALPEEYAPVATQYAPHGDGFGVELEERTLSASHAEVSAMVLAEWSLPDSICTAVRLSHDNTVESTNEANHMAMVINASDRVGKLLCEIPDVTQSAEECVAAMQFVGAELAVLEKVLGEVEADVEELAGMLKIDVIPSAVYAKIAEAIRERLAVGAG